MMLYNELAKIKSLHKSFINDFKPEWKLFLKNINPEFSNATQLNIGNHTRPFLVLWGYLIDKDFDKSNISDNIIQLSISIEAIHKASVIIDDIIDGDQLRRGQKCMHMEYGEYPTIFFAVCMLAKAIDKVNTLLSIGSSQLLQTQIISLLCDTIYSMCNGAILEITSTPEKQINLNRVKEIIDSETAQLIKNSLLIGFLYNKIDNTKLENNIHVIGRKCGYVFQVMNDLEVFCNPGYIEKYKGNLNSDFLRSRKSIVLPVLYEHCDSSEKSLLIDILLNQEKNFDYIKGLFDKYNLKYYFKTNIENTYISIENILDEINTLINNTTWVDYFKTFIEITFNQYLNNLN